MTTTDRPDGAARMARWRRWWTRDVLIVAVPAVALVAVTFIIAARYIQPAPPDRLVMATGAAGGAYQKYGEQYREHLARFGVTLELRQTNGAAENFALLRDGRVDVAFVQGGVGRTLPEVNGEPPVVSLGALYTEPLWVFQSVKRPPVDTLTALSGSRIAIGAEGSGTRALALQLLLVSGVDSKNTLLLPIGGDDLAAALDAGEVDVVFQVGGIEAPIIEQLLRRRDLRPMSFAQAAAHARRSLYLRELTVPRGIVDLATDLPDRDITTVATTANLLAQNKLHPALMYLLLDTATDVNSGHARLAEAGTYPNARGQEMPLANEAQRYYKSGKPFLKNYLPYWAANFVDRMLILLIPLVGVLIPAFKLAPALYTYRLKSRIGAWYGRLAEIDVEMARRPSAEKVDECIARLDAIEAEIGAARLPNWLSEQLYLLRAAIDLVRERLGTPGAKAHPGLRALQREDAGLGTSDRPA